MGEKIIITLPTGEKYTLYEDDYKKYLKWKNNQEAKFDPFAIPITKK